MSQFNREWIGWCLVLGVVASYLAGTNVNEAGLPLWYRIAAQVGVVIVVYGVLSGIRVLVQAAYVVLHKAMLR